MPLFRISRNSLMPVGPAAPMATRPISAAPQCPAIATPPGPGGMATAPVPPCQSASGGMGAAPGNSPSQLAFMAIGGLFGLITIASIGLKYKKYGSYYSFWGRILALALAAACMYVGAASYGDYKSNDCTNLFGSIVPGDVCPCLLCSGVLIVLGLFHLSLNLPYIYASDEKMSKMYAAYSLFRQASTVGTVCGAATGALQFMQASMIMKAVAAAGMLVSGLFSYGYMLGEDGALQRMLDGAKELLDGVSKAATEMVDGGLAVLGLDSDSRKKVTEGTVYIHCRVQRGPDWSYGEDDGGDGIGGELFGFETEDGRKEGKPVTKGKGWAIVKWDNDKLGNAGKWGEYRIGANKKFDLISIDEADDAGITDQLFGMFGFAGDEKTESTEKEQIDFYLDVKPQKKDAKLALWVEVFDSQLSLKGVANEETKGFYRGALRYREVGLMVVVVAELNKLPPDASFLVISARPFTGFKLKDFTGGLTLKAHNHIIEDLCYEPASFNKKFETHQNNEAFIFWIFAKKQVGDKSEWYAVKPHQAPFTPGRGSSALAPVVAQLEPVAGKMESDKKFFSGLFNVTDKISELEMRAAGEAKAKELLKKQLSDLTAKLEAALVKKGQPAATAKIIATKTAALQMKRVQGQLYDKTFKSKVIQYVKSGKSATEAQALAKRDAQDEVAFGGKKAQVMEEVKADAEAKEKEAVAKKKEEEEAYNNSFTGKAMGMFSFGGEAEEKPKKKKKKDESSPEKGKAKESPSNKKKDK